MKAFVDSREPDDVKLRLLKGSAKEDRKHEWEKKELPQGDFYLPEHDVVVERKEASDFASSTTDGRLSRQADRMVAEHEHVFLIIENSIERGQNGLNSLYDLPYSKINNNSITGMQTSLAVKRGIKIIYTESISDTCYAVNRIFERFMDEEHLQDESGYVKTADTGEVDDVQVAMISQIDGVSTEKAKTVSEEIKSIEKLCSTLAAGQEAEATEKLKSIDGIGDVTASKIVNAFR